jgi:uncharacterized Rossmann fold enzyme
VAVGILAVHCRLPTSKKEERRERTIKRKGLGWCMHILRMLKNMDVHANREIKGKDYERI